MDDAAWDAFDDATRPRVADTISVTMPSTSAAERFAKAAWTWARVALRIPQRTASSMNFELSPSRMSRLRRKARSANSVCLETVTVQRVVSGSAMKSCLTDSERKGPNSHMCRGEGT